MNASNAHRYLPFVIALTKGKVIETYSASSDKWVVSPNPKFVLPPERYRIKEEPEEETPAPTLKKDDRVQIANHRIPGFPLRNGFTVMMVVTVSTCGRYATVREEGKTKKYGVRTEWLTLMVKDGKKWV